MSSEQNVIKGLFVADAWQNLLAKSERGAATECWQNVCVILTHHPAWRGKLAFNSFAQVPVKLSELPTGSPAGEWTPEDEYKVGLWLAHQLQFTIKSGEQLNKGVMACAYGAKFHPIVDWLRTLDWDGVPRLNTWLSDCFGVLQSEYSALVGRFAIMNMVQRVYEPGCIMRYVPILEGAQNKGKSTALRILGGEWYSDAHLDLTNKDAFELIQGTWVQEIAEMGSFNRAETNRVKHFISQPSDVWVPKYVRGRIKVPRQVVFWGSTNEKQYLKDWTGNTRYLPLRCLEQGDIELKTLEAQRAQLFAEAIVLLAQGIQRYATPEQEAAFFVPQQDERQVDHPWREPIVAYIEDPKPEGRTDVIGMHELLTKACHVDTSKQTILMQQDVGRIMDSLGWDRKREPKGLRRWFYHRPAAEQPVGNFETPPVDNDDEIPI